MQDYHPTVVVYLPGQSEALAAALQGYKLKVELIPCDTEEDAVRECRNADILVSLPINRAAYDGAHNLRWIQSLSAGVEGWIRSAPAHIPITRMAGVYERYMAEYVFAYLLYGSQSLRRIHEQQARHEWAPFNTRSVSGLWMGIAGAGLVGQAIAKLARSFGMNVAFLGRTSKRASEVSALSERFFILPELAQFLRDLDVLVITLPATPDSNRIFGLNEFLTLPKGATVINVGRGIPVDEQGLFKALNDGHLGAAIIDTFRHEPLEPTDVLWTAPNLTITPHMAGAVYAPELAAVVVKNTQTFLAGRIPEPVVDREAGY